jgi:hypothetical protein
MALFLGSVENARVAFLGVAEEFPYDFYIVLWDTKCILTAFMSS